MPTIKLVLLLLEGFFMPVIVPLCLLIGGSGGLNRYVMNFKERADRAIAEKKKQKPPY